MASWSKHNNICRRCLYDHVVELNLTQWYTTNPTNTAAPTNGTDLGGYIWLNNFICDEIENNNAFTAYVVARASVNGGVSDHHWDMISIIEGPHRYKMIPVNWIYQQSFMQKLSIPTDIPLLSNTTTTTIRECWYKEMSLNNDYKIYISFPTKQQAMLFKLIHHTPY